VTAAVLFNFVKFVEWPVDAFHESSSPLALCVLGDDAIADSLDAVVQGEKLNGRPLVVRRLSDARPVRECHVVFIGPLETGRLPDVLGRLAASNVLTVGEGDRFLDQGGMIRLFLEQNRLRFDVNLDAAERSHLKLSSKLLRLARAVNPQRREG
jgi:hypothetical protein